MPKNKRKSKTIKLSQKTSTVKKLNRNTGRPPEHSLHWTEQTDKFVFDSAEKSTSLPVTLRTFLCFIASVLIDFMNLITLYCELIMQEVRQQKQSRNGHATFEFMRNVLQTILQLLTAQTTRCLRKENIYWKCTSELYYIAHTLTAMYRTFYYFKDLIVHNCRNWINTAKFESIITKRNQCACFHKEYGESTHHRQISSTCKQMKQIPCLQADRQIRKLGRLASSKLHHEMQSRILLLRSYWMTTLSIQYRLEKNKQVRLKHNNLLFTQKHWILRGLWHRLFQPTNCTLLTAIINPSGPDDHVALTPNMLLTFTRRPATSPGNFDEKDVYSKRWWRQA